MKRYSLWTLLFGRRPTSPTESTERPTAQDALVATLQAFMNAPGLDQKRSIVKQHPELLSPEADALLTQGRDDRAMAMLTKYRRLLDMCRERGVDATFDLVERQQHEGAPDQKTIEHLIKVIQARNFAEMEQAIREDPRVVERRTRYLLKTFIAARGTFGRAMAHIQVVLQLLEACERLGIDATFRSMQLGFVHTSKDGSTGTILFQPGTEAMANPIKAFNELIQEFDTGRDPDEVAARARSLLQHVPQTVTGACILINLITSHRAGDAAEARRAAMQLNALASGWDLPGIPQRSAAMGEAIVEAKDVGPILAALDEMSRMPDCSEEEQEAIRALVSQYIQRKEQVTG